MSSYQAHSKQQEQEFTNENGSRNGNRSRNGNGEEDGKVNDKKLDSQSQTRKVLSPCSLETRKMKELTISLPDPVPLMRGVYITLSGNTTPSTVNTMGQEDSLYSINKVDSDYCYSPDDASFFENKDEEEFFDSFDQQNLKHHHQPDLDLAGGEVGINEKNNSPSKRFAFEQTQYLSSNPEDPLSHGFYTNTTHPSTHLHPSNAIPIPTNNTTGKSYHPTTIITNPPTITATAATTTANKNTTTSTTYADSNINEGHSTSTVTATISSLETERVSTQTLSGESRESCESRESVEEGRAKTNSCVKVLNNNNNKKESTSTTSTRRNQNNHERYGRYSNSKFSKNNSSNNHINKYIRKRNSNNNKSHVLHDNNQRTLSFHLEEMNKLHCQYISMVQDLETMVEEKDSSIENLTTLLIGEQISKQKTIVDYQQKLSELNEMMLTSKRKNYLLQKQVDQYQKKSNENENKQNVLIEENDNMNSICSINNMKSMNISNSIFQDTADKITTNSEKNATITSCASISSFATTCLDHFTDEKGLAERVDQI